MIKISILLFSIIITIYAKSTIETTFQIKSITLKSSNKKIMLPLKKYHIKNNNGFYTILLKKAINTKGTVTIILVDKNNKKIKININAKKTIKDKISFKLYLKGDGSKDQDKYVAEVKHF